MPKKPHGGWKLFLWFAYRTTLWVLFFLILVAGILVAIQGAIMYDRWMGITGCVTILLWIICYASILQMQERK